MPRARKPKCAPSETYAARVARGRIPVSITLSPEALARLDELVVRIGMRATRGEAIAVAVARMLETLPT